MIKTNLKRTVLTLALILSCVCSSPAFADKTGWELVPEILARIVPPTFPDIDYVITDHGAVGDGVTDCNPAFKKAIAACTLLKMPQSSSAQTLTIIFLMFW